MVSTDAELRMDRFPEIERSVLLYYAGSTILDGPTHWYYWCLNDGDPSACQNQAVSNGAAGEWYGNLQLSGLLEGETEPPAGRVGQYGRHGCVLSEAFDGVLDSATDIVLVPYARDELEPFLWELKAKTGARFRETTLDVLAVNELYLLSCVDPWAEDETRVPGQPIRVETEHGLEHAVHTDVHGALAWGREHARRLTDASSAGS